MLRKWHCKLNGGRGGREKKKEKKKEKGRNPTKSRKKRKNRSGLAPPAFRGWSWSFCEAAAGPQGRGQRGAEGAACRCRSAPPEGARAPPLRSRRAPLCAPAAGAARGAGNGAGERTALGTNGAGRRTALGNERHWGAAMARGERRWLEELTPRHDVQEQGQGCPARCGKQPLPLCAPPQASARPPAFLLVSGERLLLLSVRVYVPGHCPPHPPFLGLHGGP